MIDLINSDTDVGYGSLGHGSSMDMVGFACQIQKMAQVKKEHTI